MLKKNFARLAGLLAAATVLPLSAAPLEPAKEGAELLQLVWQDAFTVRQDASALVGYYRRTISPDTYAARYFEIHDSINDMGAKLRRLEAIRDSLPAWQREALARVEPTAVGMARVATTGINYLNANRLWLSNPEYARTNKELYAQAVQFTDALGSFEKLAKLGHQEERLEQTLGVKAD